MHGAPTDREHGLYLEQNRTYFYALGILSFLLITAGMVLFMLVSPWFLLFLPLVLLQSVYIFISYYIGIRGKDFALGEIAVNAYVYGNFTAYRPIVDVFLPVCNEPIELIGNTFKHVAKIDYPNFDVWVLDDGQDEAVEKLALEHNFNYMTRTQKTLKKAGNLRAAFQKTSGELILILDADFCPMPSILKSLVPYMRNEEIAIVQTPQFFSVDPHQPWIEKGASYVQELFYRLIQVSRDTFGASVCVGTCALYRRSSLAPFGGTYPIDYSEDLHTGFQILVSGEKVKYTPLVVAKGICPSDHGSFFRQQYRWAVGSISLFLNPWFWKSKVTFHQRLCYLTGMLYYISTGISIVVAPLPGILIAWAFPEHLFLWNSIYAIPSLIFGTFFMAYWSRHKWGFYAPMGRHIAYVAHLSALLERLLGRVRPWVPSNGQGAEKEAWPTPLYVARLWNYFVFLALCAGIIYNLDAIHPWHWIMTVALAGYNFTLNYFALKTP